MAAERPGHESDIDALFDCAPVGLCLLDRELRFRRINRRLAEFNGHSIESHIGRGRVAAAVKPVGGNCEICVAAMNSVAQPSRAARRLRKVAQPFRAAGGARMKSLGRLAAAGMLLAAAACGGMTTPTLETTSSSPYKQIDLTVGTGAEAVAGKTVIVAYTGWLYETAQPDGKGRQFDSNANFSFPLGAGQVIAGWDRGVAGMRVGGQRRLIIPPDLAYGAAGAGGGAIPPNATLIFDITLNGVE